MYLPYTQLPDPTDKFEIYEEIAQGVNAKVFRAKELDNDRMVALKIQHYDEEHQISIEEEYRTLRDHCNHPNLPEFYGVYKLEKSNAPDEIWFVLEYCSGGTAVDMVNKLIKLERRMREEHIAYIIREICRGAIELNRNHVIHRDIRGDNILLTKDARVKLCDFGLSREVDSTFGKRGTCIGSPCWMAPEVVTAMSAKDAEISSRADVWALGITTIELADGQPPFADMHPTRVMFQIVRNPPPTLLRPTNWSQQINDFVSECLEKNVENRPMMVEMIEHPFLNELFDNEEEMQADLRELLVFCRDAPPIYKELEIFVDRGYIKRFDGKPERMYPEDLAAIENPSDEMILESLRSRMELGGSYSFIGDVLLSLNSNDLQTDFDEEFHSKYKFKSRSQNSPHIFAVADIAYQDMLHHKEPQHVVFSGESFSGKSTNVRLLINHLCYLGAGNRGATLRVENSIEAIQMLVNAGTPINNESTRCVLQYFLTFGQTGKLSGAVFNMYMLEKLRVSTTDMNQHNFHIFYYFYDFMNSESLLKEYHLKSERGYRYLRIPAEMQPTKLKYHRDDPINNVEHYKRFECILQDLDFNHKQLETLRKEADDIPTDNLNFYDNKTALDNLLTKPDGLFYIIDDASRTSQDQDLIMDRVVEKHSQFVKKHTATEISVAHYTGRIIYDTRAFTDINRDFVPPEMIESFRSSMDENIMLMFTNQLTKAGNLTMPFESVQHKPEDSQRKSYPLNTLSAGCISQVNNLRTLAANFRFTCLALLKTLTLSSNLGVHFVRCIRADLEYKPRAFHSDMVQQQMKALGVLDTVVGRQRGYSCRITFQEFLRRYQFLAFDFDETVDITKENCRLLMIRLKMEGWAIGKTKVFLRYYNDEFLARLYEVQVKKVIKVQSMMRALLARKRMKGGKDPKKAKGVTRNDEAATKIQKAFRGYHERQRFQPLVNEKTGQLNEETAVFIRVYAKKWREKSLFQVLLHYRAARFQDFVNLAQQVHIYNQRFFAGINKCTRNVPFDRINTREVNSSQLGPLPIPTKKLPFRLDQIPFYDTQYMVNAANSISRQNFSNTLITYDDEDAWDSPLQRNPSMTSCLLTYNAYKKEQACQTNWDRIGESDVIYNQNYYRDPQLVKRNQVQMNMNAYNNYNQYNNNYNTVSSNMWSNRTGSRRNSLKSYSAPPPPPMPPLNMVYRNDQIQARTMQQNPNQLNRINQNYQQRSSFVPSDPIRELKDIARRSNDGDSPEEPPFNFKAMLRKTNYSRSDSTVYELNNQMTNNNNENISFQPSKLRSTSRRPDDYNNHKLNSSDQHNFVNRAPSLQQTAVGKSFDNTDAKSFEEAGSYVEEEIAPGVTLSGYAVDI
ncbi:neither inactivation nor afterpotential protein C isoform X3 [Bactrocera dorsalis]|uniref:non-specific serine/threonine protein kinase n=1 Tax=Bactrocera dorsalis TaxID=27457 RepID=A0ABM3J927_BACDO|nr:neither inactivation nor afterpotential protein C isoform X3 [Bactrocera dorsalis]